MWRRVSCEQPLDTSQSILRLRGNLNQMFGALILLEKPNWSRKGIWLIFQNLVMDKVPHGTSAATQADWETPTEAQGRVIFSA